MKEARQKLTQITNPAVKVRQTAVTMLNQADMLIQAGFYDSAVTLLSGVLMIDPSRMSAIHKIGKCLEESGAEEDAISCYRGALPESITQKYFNSEQLANKIRSASDCANVTLLQGFDEERIALDAPVRNKVDKNYGEFNYQETYAQAAFCTVADQGAVWFDGINTVALDCHSNAIKEQSKGDFFSSYHAIQTSEPVSITGTVCFLDGRSSSIYYHWMLDILPKIGVVKAAGIDLDEIDYFVVSAKSKFQLETLRACGIRDDQLIDITNSPLFRADKMIVPCLKNDQGEKVYHGLGVGLSSSVAKFLQNLYGHDYTQANTGNSENLRVYISRSTRGSRNVANEPKLIAALEKRGFVTVEFERLTVAEQAELMSRTDVVVGVHGAGFTNATFCRPGTRIIEIFGDYVVPCYWALCAVAQLDYAQFMASSIEASDAVDNPGQRVVQLRDMEIDVDADEFINFLDMTLGAEVAAA